MHLLLARRLAEARFCCGARFMTAQHEGASGAEAIYTNLMVPVVGSFPFRAELAGASQPRVTITRERALRKGRRGGEEGDSPEGLLYLVVECVFSWKCLPFMVFVAIDGYFVKDKNKSTIYL